VAECTKIRWEFIYKKISIKIAGILEFSEVSFHDVLDVVVGGVGERSSNDITVTTINHHDNEEWTIITMVIKVILDIIG
jgi:hypothetical protein